MSRLVGMTVAALGAVGLPSAAWAQDRPCGWHSMWGMMWGPWGPWSLGMRLTRLTFLALVIVGIVALVRRLSMPGHPLRTDAALDILRQRYARGEINREEFEAKEQDLA